MTDAVIERLVREDMPEPQKSVIMGVLGLSSEAPPPAQEPAGSAQLTWQGESEKMVEKILGVIPEMLRGAVKPKLLDFISSKAGPGGSVTENMVVEAIEEMKPPEPFMSRILNVLAAGTGIDLSEADAILSRYQGKQEAVLSLFHELQKEYGYLPKAVLTKVSEHLSMPLSAAYRLATSYERVVRDGDRIGQRDFGEVAAAARTAQHLALRAVARPKRDRVSVRVGDRERRAPRAGAEDPNLHR